MATVERRVTIQAPVETLFAYMDNPDHQAEIASDATTIESVERLPSGGIKSRYSYDVAGMSFTGQLETVRYQPNRCIVFNLSGGLDGTITWNFQAIDATTSQMTYRGDYSVNLPFLGDSVAAVAAKFNETEIETQLSNLKRILEAPARSQ